MHYLQVVGLGAGIPVLVAVSSIGHNAFWYRRKRWGLRAWERLAVLIYFAAIGAAFYGLAVAGMLIHDGMSYGSSEALATFTAVVIPLFLGIPVGGEFSRFTVEMIGITVMRFEH